MSGQVYYHPQLDKLICVRRAGGDMIVWQFKNLEMFFGHKLFLREGWIRIGDL